VEVSHLKASGGNSLFLWVPRPLDCATQRGVKAVQSSEKPTVDNFRGLMLYQFKDAKDSQSLKVLHDFILSSYEVETQPKVEAIKAIRDSSPIKAAFTAEEPEIPVKNADVAKAAADAVGRERNPWKQARLLYDWVESSISIKADRNKGTALTALKEKSGDAYSVSLLYVAMCRSLGIPAAPVSGVWMDERQATHPHWWAEFFIDGLGWIPVDPAFGSLAPGALAGPTRDKEGLDRRAYYFGNMDNDRIVFSRGFASLVPQEPNSTLKPHGRFYSLQTITEEASAGIESYTSFWSDIEITGVY
jgi:transglutaminase-like putative cysteine protease